MLLYSSTETIRLLDVESLLTNLEGCPDMMTILEIEIDENDHPEWTIKEVRMN